MTSEAPTQERYELLLERERRRIADLEAQVRERTAELERSGRELRSLRAQLARSERLSSIGQLVAGLAHEINNPINFIHGNADFLRAYVGKFLALIRELDGMITAPEHRARADELKRAIELDYLVQDTDKLLASIRNGAERATTIIRDLRAFIHGGAAGERAPVDIVRCVEATLDLVTHQTRGRIDIVRDFEGDVPAVPGSAGTLEQVLMNLVVNAIQAIPARGTITVSVRRRDGGVGVDVSDDGVGISEADQLELFEPFFTTKPAGQGTGLGLSISRSVIAAHGGELTVKSRLGEGSTFSVWLPLGPVRPPTG